MKKVFSGFTLVEVVVVLAISSIVGLVLVNIFLGHADLFRFFNAEVNSGSAARLVADRMVSLIREAESVQASHDFSGQLRQSTPDELVLRLKTVNASDAFVIGAYDYVAFYRDGDDPRRLMETIQADAASRRASGTRVLAENLEILNLAYDNPTIQDAREVTLELRMAEDFRQTSATSTVKTVVKLRNRN